MSESRSRRWRIAVAVIAASLPLLVWRSYAWGYRCGGVQALQIGLYAELVSDHLVKAELRHGTPEEQEDALKQRLLTLDLNKAVPGMESLKTNIETQRLWILLLMWQTEQGLSQNDRAAKHLEEGEQICTAGALEKDCSEVGLNRTAQAVRELLSQ